MRGVFYKVMSFSISERIIPAHAGSIKGKVKSSTVERDHPRSCGEYRTF